MKSEKALTDINEVPFLLGDSNIYSAFPDNRQLVLFLDYDGTLSPIVSKPEDAFLLTGMKEVVEKCVSRYIVSVISGRDTDDVRKRVDIEGIIYAGSHGFSIKGPGDLQMEHEKAFEIMSALSSIEAQLRKIFFNGPEGVMIERKKYAITIHFRNAEPERIDEIKKMTEEVVAGLPGIKKESGKMILEIKPDVAWNKGMAVQWILKKLGLWNDPVIFPVYVGDDLTDEDAFRILQGKGMGIIVGSHDHPTAADFRLVDVNEVREFLERISESSSFFH